MGSEFSNLQGGFFDSALPYSPERRKQRSDGQRPSDRIDGHAKSERLAQVAEGLRKPQRVCASLSSFKGRPTSDGRWPSLRSASLSGLGFIARTALAETDTIELNG